MFCPHYSISFNNLHSFIFLIPPFMTKCDLFLFDAESWKEIRVFPKVCTDAGNASVPLLPDLWIYRK